MSLALPFTANLFSLGVKAHLIEICDRRVRKTAEMIIFKQNFSSAAVVQVTTKYLPRI
jgi:hypothetical protein